MSDRYLIDVDRGSLSYSYNQNEAQQSAMHVDNYWDVLCVVFVLIWLNYNTYFTFTCVLCCHCSKDTSTSVVDKSRTLVFHMLGGTWQYPVWDYLVSSVVGSLKIYSSISLLVTFILVQLGWLNHTVYAYTYIPAFLSVQWKLEILILCQSQLIFISDKRTTIMYQY